MREDLVGLHKPIASIYIYVRIQTGHGRFKFNSVGGRSPPTEPSLESGT